MIQHECIDGSPRRKSYVAVSFKTTYQGQVITWGQGSSFRTRMPKSRDRVFLGRGYPPPLDTVKRDTNYPRVVRLKMGVWVPPPPAWVYPPP